MKWGKEAFRTKRQQRNRNLEIPGPVLPTIPE